MKELFSSSSRGRENNDKDNRGREHALSLLWHEDSGISATAIADSCDKNFWSDVRHKLSNALHRFILEEDGEDFNLQYLVHKGGRTFNYDFEAKGVSGNRILEYKTGKSIFDHPQFLSLYVQGKDFVSSEFESYAEFTYDNFGHELAQLAEQAIPSRDRYLADVSGSNYKKDPFFESLYDLSNTKVGNENLGRIANKSIDDYLKWLESEGDFLDLSAIKRRMEFQASKLFISWDQARQDFNIEKFTPEDTLILESPIFKARPKSNIYSTIILGTKAGGSIEALLRWKNHHCVLGPAWQIKLKPSR